MSIKKNIEKLFELETNYKIWQETGIAQSTLSDLKNGKAELGNMKLDHAVTLNNYYKEMEKMNYSVTAIKHEKFINTYGMEIEGEEILASERVPSSVRAEKLAKKYYDTLEGVDYIEIVAPNAQLAVCYWHPQEGASATSYNWCDHFDAGGEV